MGFRSKMMTEDYSGLMIPDWFVHKYPYLSYGKSGRQYIMSLSDVWERKYYGELAKEELFLDIQKVLVENEYGQTLSVVLLHECGGITLVLINKDAIRAREPLTWKEVEYVEHNYCSGCSEPKV